jgi:hypothetical protein
MPLYKLFKLVDEKPNGFSPRKWCRQELLKIIEQWSEAKRIESFINQIESEIHLKHPDDQQSLLNQLDKAKLSLGNLSALDAIAHWRSPEDRLSESDTF